MMLGSRRPASGVVSRVLSRGAQAQGAFLSVPPWRPQQATTPAQIRKTLAHMHRQSALVFGSRLTFDGARWQVCMTS